MPTGHYTSAGASIEYGDADCLFPVAELDATILQYRDAELALDDVDGTSVIIVVPTSLATSYRLTQHPLTAIPVDTLSSTVQTQIAAIIEVPLGSFEFIQIGKGTPRASNYSLTEFIDA